MNLFSSIIYYQIQLESYNSAVFFIVDNPNDATSIPSSYSSSGVTGNIFIEDELLRACSQI